MNMTRQHFESIAHVLDANLASIELVEDFADMCEESNALFNRKRFIKASTLHLRVYTEHVLDTLDTEWE